MLNGHGCHWRSADLVGDIFANHRWQDRVRKTPSAFIPIALVATLLTSGVGVAAPAETARVDDCLSAPNSAAPQGSHWYYRLDRATKRKCWYVRALGQPAQQAAAPVTIVPATSLHSTPAPSGPNPAPEGPGVSVGPGEAAAPPPLTEMPAATPKAAPAISAATDNTASSIPDKPAPPVAPAISATTDQSVQQSAQEDNTGSIPNAPAPQARTSSETGDQAVAPGTDRPELDPYDDPEFYRKLREGVAFNKP